MAQFPPTFFFITLVLVLVFKKKKTKHKNGPRNNTTQQGQKVQRVQQRVLVLALSGTLSPLLYLLSRKQCDGQAERVAGSLKKSEQSLTAALPEEERKTKEPSLPVGLWESRL